MIKIKIIGSVLISVLNINSFLNQVYSQEGEIILGEIEYLGDQQKKQTDKLGQKKNQNPNSPKQNNSKPVPSEKKYLSEMEIEKELKLLLKNIKQEIFNELKKDIIKVLRKLVQEKKITNQNQLKTIIKKTIKYDPKINQLKIAQIKIGNDQPKQIKNDKTSLPILVTIQSPINQKNGKLSLYAIPIKNSQKKYLIYELEKFQFTGNWAQDQLNWDGFYIQNGIKKKLPNGKYWFMCSVIFKKRKKIQSAQRNWGRGNKNYYITIN